uniref:protein disulfide-isomerase n=1 Tax=Lygus hesperus TaxID=30085 RepID=A0A0K8T6S4_LYGHE
MTQVKMFHTVAAILLGAQALTLDIEEEAGVLVLNENNFDEAVKIHEYILVEFYAPWCGACVSFAPEYVKAASRLSDRKSSIKLAKVDATMEERLADKYNVNYLPTLKFFTNSNPTDYDGGMTDREIVDWLRLKSQPNRGEAEELSGPVHILTTAGSLDAFLTTHEKALVAYCSEPNSQLLEIFKQASLNVKDHSFGLVQDASLINSTEFVEDGQIHLHKRIRIGMYDLPRVEYKGGFDVNELQKFIEANSFPTILQLEPKTAQYVFNSEVKTHVLLLVSSLNGEFETLAEPLMNVAQEIRERAGNVMDKSVLFVVVDTDNADHSKLLTILGVQKKLGSLPTIRIIKLGKKGEPIKKYKPAGSLGIYWDPERVKKFVEDYLEGKLESYLISQKLPKDWDANPVKVLTAENFDDIAFDKEKNVLVQFYSPWCGYCHRLEPIYEEVAKVFSRRFDGGVDYIIAKIDATANELENTNITQYPTIKLYKRGTNKVIDFIGKRSVEALVKFVETGGKSLEQV